MCLQVIIMFFEDPEICPFLESTKPQLGISPHCVMIYDDLTLWTLEKLCHKNFEKCPVYQKAKKRKQQIIKVPTVFP